MVYVAARLVLREGDRERLESLVRSASAPAGDGSTRKTQQFNTRIGILEPHTA
jgi:hypothetical protein